MSAAILTRTSLNNRKIKKKLQCSICAASLSLFLTTMVYSAPTKPFGGQTVIQDNFSSNYVIFLPRLFGVEGISIFFQYNGPELVGF